MSRKDREVTIEAGIRLAGRSAEGAEFEALFLAHYAGICRYLTRLLGSAQEAEDLAQETFVRLFRQRPDGGEGRLRPWLYRAATNLAYNALRDDQRRARRQELAAEESSSGDDPAEAALRAEERANVRQALARLAAREAQLLMLRYGGLSYAEIADSLGLAPGSVGTLLARAEAAFARVYGSLFPSEKGGAGDARG
jgi:RNA polymerase sigma-70 factor (ECF subfamily)